MIGTLLGSVHPDGSVDVRNSYAVPHNEQNGQVFVDVEFHRAMAELHGKVNPTERVIGWYSTGDGVVPTDALIHEFYAHECAAPVHVTLDVGFAGNGTLMRAWTGKSVAIAWQRRWTRARRVGRSRRAAYLSQMLKTTTGWTFAEATWPTPITGRKATMSAARRREGAPARI